ncbi:MAG: DUF4625 domain-containing protein [Flavobacteriales bacterium]|nr:DUF4625 domain-containing protein [Flavobacteriales bacterium]
MIRNIFHYFFLAILVGGCSKIDDTEKPIVIINSPLAGDAITTNSGLHLMATLTDNTGLLQYKIVITGIDSLNDVAADSTFSITLINGISEKPEEFILDYVVSLNESTFNGHYQLTLSCVDVEGNEALRDTVLFQIKNSTDNVPPVIDVASLVINDTLGFGMGFALSGMVTDERSLIYSDIFIGRSNFSDTIRYTDFPWISNNTVDYTTNFSWFHQVDSTWSQGTYHVYYTAWDNYSGVSHTIPFYVKY